MMCSAIIQGALWQRGKFHRRYIIRLMMFRQSEKIHGGEGREGDPNGHGQAQLDVNWGLGEPKFWGWKLGGEGIPHANFLLKLKITIKYLIFSVWFQPPSSKLHSTFWHCRCHCAALHNGNRRRNHCEWSISAWFWWLWPKHIIC